MVKALIFIWLAILSTVAMGQYTVANDIRLEVEYQNVVTLHIPSSEFPRSIEVYGLASDGSITNKGTTINTHRKHITSSWVAESGKYIIKVYNTGNLTKILLDEVIFEVEPTQPKE